MVAWATRTMHSGESAYHQDHISESTHDRFGDLLFRHRDAQGMTQEDLAQRSGLSVRTISDLERGRTRKPHRRSLQLLARALGLNQAEIARFFRAQQERTEPRATADGFSGPVCEGAIERVLPRQLPMAALHFSGRCRELEKLSGMLGESARAAVMTTISGPAGVGKTALAVHWGHQVACHFPDGQLYLNLRGSDPAAPPMAPPEAVRSLLDAFQISPGRIPVSLDAQAALYRSLVAGKRMLIVLDDAGDAAQVCPLLPGSAGCLVVVTSRHPLTSLVATHGAHPIRLDKLAAREAMELLARLLGTKRVAANERAAAQLVERYGRMPHALCAAAADIACAHHRHLTLVELEAAGSRRR